jgi:hypothetical protein
MIQDEWMDDVLKLGITIHIPQISFYMSKQTIPRLLSFLYRVGAIFSEKRIMADSLLINILGPLYSGKKIVVIQDVPRQVLSLSSFYGFIVSDLKVFSNQCFGTLSGNRYWALILAFEIRYVHKLKLLICKLPFSNVRLQLPESKKRRYWLLILLRFEKRP